MPGMKTVERTTNASHMEVDGFRSFEIQCDNVVIKQVAIDRMDLG